MGWLRSRHVCAGTSPRAEDHAGARGLRRWSARGRGARGGHRGAGRPASPGGGKAGFRRGRPSAGQPLRRKARWVPARRSLVQAPVEDHPLLELPLRPTARAVAWHCSASWELQAGCFSRGRSVRALLNAGTDGPVSDLVPALEALTTPSQTGAWNQSQESESLAPGRRGWQTMAHRRFRGHALPPLPEGVLGVWPGSSESPRAKFNPQGWELVDRHWLPRPEARRRPPLTSIFPPPPTSSLGFLGSLPRKRPSPKSFRQVSPWRNLSLDQGDALRKLRGPGWASQRAE